MMIMHSWICTTMCLACIIRHGLCILRYKLCPIYLIYLTFLTKNCYWLKFICWTIFLVTKYFFWTKNTDKFWCLVLFFLRKDVHILHYCIVERQKCDRAQTKNPPTGGKKKTDNVPKLFALLDLCGRIANSYLPG